MTIHEWDEKLLNLFSAAPVGIGLVNNRVIMEANDTLYDMTGYSRSEMLGRNSRFLYPEENDYDFVGDEKCRQLRETGRGIVETRWRKKNGSIINIILSSTSLDPDDMSKGFAFIALDITERKLAEQALAASETRYRNLVELAGDGIMLANRDGTIMSMNTQLEKMLCRTRDELIGHNIDELFTEESLAEKPIRYDLLLRGETVISERFLKRPDGDRLMVETHSKMMPDGMFQSIGRDITERKRLLESFQRSRKLESLAKLAGGMAHDFNNILGGVLGYIDLARNLGRKGENNVHYLDKVLPVFEKAKILTGRLMTFSRGGEPSLKTGDLVPVIKRHAESALKGSDFKCSYDLADDLWMCDFDDTQIGQVVYNMVSNSRDFMDPGGEIIIKAANVTLGQGGLLPEGRYLRVSVTDRGPGIRPDILPYIFDPFYTTKEKGDGLGLSTSYSIIQRHGGIMDVESVPGSETVAWFYLPASDEKKPASADIAFDSHHGNGTIMVMDDEPFIRDIISGMLELMGYNVIQASDGVEILKHLREYHGDPPLRCVILDLTVPGGMGGGDTVGEILRMDVKVPVFAFSGYSDDRIMSNPRDFGFTDSIRKPFTIDELSAVLNRYL